jgi:hypothetical protein
MAGFMNEVEVLGSVALGIGLAAAVGLRVFLPFFVMSIAAHSGYLELGSQFQWLATLPALVVLGVASLLEILAYYVPGVDNLLDAIATPAAVVAGSVAAAAVMTDLPPVVKWTTAIIAGGGLAGMTQGATALLRAKSTATTGGLGNPVIATGELGGSVLVAILAIAAPLVALILIVLFCWFVVKLVRRILARPQVRPSPNPLPAKRGEGAEGG